VIRKVGRENIIIIATKEKLISLADRPLLVDTGDQALDRELSGYMRVTTGYRDYVMCKLGC
jgi:predicted polyphosphate/ATP-dependent NAD kinase